MLKMRLQRRGKKNCATVKGRFVADLGSYNPHTDIFNVNGEKVADWLSQGVQPSSTVHNLLVTHKMLKADKVKSWRPKKREGGEIGEERVEKEEEKEEKKEETKET